MNKYYKLHSNNGVHYFETNEEGYSLREIDKMVDEVSGQDSFRRVDGRISAVDGSGGRHMNLHDQPFAMLLEQDDEASEHEIPEAEFEAAWTRAQSDGMFEITTHFASLGPDCWISCDHTNLGPHGFPYRVTVSGLDMMWLRSEAAVKDLFSHLQSLDDAGREQAAAKMEAWKLDALARS